MKSYIGIMLRAVIIAALASVVGLGLNVVSSNPIPWVYVPPIEVELTGGVKATLIDEKEARKLLEEEGTIFIDSRHKDDYEKQHVKGALFLCPEDKEEQFVAVQPLMPEDSRLILYCYGPQCDMAEEVAKFLVQLGYKKMMIMSAGFKAWKQADYPVEGSETN
jgi:rhodanese-related sulfurtransferase